MIPISCMHKGTVEEQKKFVHPSPLPPPHVTWHKAGQQCSCYCLTSERTFEFSPAKRNTCCELASKVAFRDRTMGHCEVSTDNIRFIIHQNVRNVQKKNAKVTS